MIWLPSLNWLMSLPFITNSSGSGLWSFDLCYVEWWFIWYWPFVPLIYSLCAQNFFPSHSCLHWICIVHLRFLFFSILISIFHCFIWFYICYGVCSVDLYAINISNVLILRSTLSFPYRLAICSGFSYLHLPSHSLVDVTFLAYGDGNPLL